MSFLDIRSLWRLRSPLIGYFGQIKFSACQMNISPNQMGQKRLRIMSLTDNVPYIMAWVNDEGYERVFVEQLKNFAEPGALLIAISGSGNSANVLRAVEYAKSRGMRTFALTGFDGGRLKQIADDSLHVCSDNMGAVETVHAVVIHYLMDGLVSEFAALSQ